MKSKLLFLLALCATAAFAQPQKPAPTVPGSMNWILHIEAAQFIGVADAMPAEKWSFAPTNGEFKGVRTFAGQVWHVACANEGFAAELEGKAPPKGCEVINDEHQSGTKDKLMPYLRETFERVQRAIETITPANMLEEVDTLYPGGKRTRLSIAATAVYHAADHYGQIVEYARMNGIVPGARPQRSDVELTTDESGRKIARLAPGITKPIRTVEAKYPPMAEMGKVQGQVLIEILISEKGRVEKEKLLSGNPMLVKAALDAVSDWKYQPFLVDGSPVAVRTTVAVNFVLR